MCIITSDIDSVSKTNIFACHIENNMQLTIYSNKVKLKKKSTSYSYGTFGNEFNFKEEEQEPVAMVLPIPSTNPAEIKMIDTTKIKDIFKNIDSMFANETYGSRGSQSLYNNSTLEVFKCGSYSYSIVPDIPSFNLLEKTFKLDSNVPKLLEKNYSDSFSFLVCILSESANYEPIGFVFPSKLPDKLFIPTLHYHGGVFEEYTNDWDHSIFTIEKNCTLNILNPLPVNNMIHHQTFFPNKAKTSTTKIEDFPYNIKWEDVVKRTIRGININRDLIVSTV